MHGLTRDGVSGRTAPASAPLTGEQTPTIKLWESGNTHSHDESGVALHATQPMRAVFAAAATSPNNPATVQDMHPGSWAKRKQLASNLHHSTAKRCLPITQHIVPPCCMPQPPFRLPFISPRVLSCKR